MNILRKIIDFSGIKDKQAAEILGIKPSNFVGVLRQEDVKFCQVVKLMKALDLVFDNEFNIKKK